MLRILFSTLVLSMFLFRIEASAASGDKPYYKGYMEYRELFPEDDWSYEGYAAHRRLIEAPRSPFQEAIHANNAQAVEELLDSGAKPTKEDLETALVFYQAGDPEREAIKVLLLKFIDPSKFPELYKKFKQ